MVHNFFGLLGGSNGVLEPEGAGTSPLNSVSDGNMCPTENSPDLNRDPNSDTVFESDSESD